MLTEENISGKVLDHLGLVTATIEKIGLIEKIDERLPLANSNAKTSMGQRVAAMILNGLGFIDDRLYMFPEFLENKPIDRLFQGDLKPEYFNDDALGRCLDAISDYGVTKLFSEVAIMIGMEQKLLGRTFNVDSTTLSVYGDYDEDESEDLEKQLEPGKDDHSQNQLKEPDVSKGAKPRHGFSKNHRPDLKQMVLNLATTGKAGFPIWMESHSGNASDKKILHEAAERMKTLCQSIKDAPTFMTVGDSAIYEACLKQTDSKMLWLTRVPETHKPVKELLRQLDSAYNWVELNEDYKISATETTYKDVPQRWLVVYSAQAHQKECKTLDKKIEKIENEYKKELWHVGNTIFKCEEDEHEFEINIDNYLKRKKYKTLFKTADKIKYNDTISE
jgi:transposase